MVTGGAVNLNLQPCLSSADASICRFGRDVGNGAAFVAVQFVPGADEIADGELAAEGAEGLEAGGEAIDEGVSDGEASEEADSDGSSCNANSFSPSTGVLLATGRLVPISRAKSGIW